jgi:hypothetical protein
LDSFIAIAAQYFSGGDSEKGDFRVRIATNYPNQISNPATSLSKLR